MLETIRQYGREKLADGGKELAVLRRHRDYYLYLAGQLADNCFGPDQREWSIRLQLDKANVWEALDFCLTQPGETRAGMRMASTLWYYWIACGFMRDGRFWLDRALALDKQPSRERAWALCINGYIATLQGDIPSSLMLEDESCAVASQCGDERVPAYAKQYLGMARLFAGDLHAAARLQDDAIARHLVSGEMNGLIALAYPQRSLTASCLGNVNQAVDLVDECESICVAHGDRLVRGWAAWVLAFGRVITGDLREARTRVRELLHVKLDFLDDLLTIPCCLDLMAVISAAEGDALRAARLLGASHALWLVVGNPRMGFDAYAELCTQCEARVRHTLGDRTYDAAYQQGTQLTVAEAVADALGEKAKAPAASLARPQPQLTRREEQVAVLVAKGLSNKDIAERLVIARRTAEAHVEHILVKLGFTSRTQIAAWVTEQPESLIEIDVHRA
ncbi:LuxR C-terminal-related transcriptional regulator [Dactylosporangium sp. CA-233914]|uniref:LuxR C-terminal-related transcriptional regulator n=1 Tax=Dactylosporangium sp. CA-233914 TaxID=3239934 RepID=UPI003D93B052